MQGSRAARKRDFALAARGLKPSSDALRTFRSARQFRFVIWTVAGVVEMDVSQPIVVGRMPYGEANLFDLTPFRGMHLGVSRHHALIRPEDEGFMIRDLRSTNGTFLNSIRLDPEYSYPIRHRDELRFGQIAMQVLLVR